jgi:predicted O-methyltransferase YrrM
MFSARHPSRRRTSLSQHLYRRFLHKYFVRDLNFELQLIARREAADYVREHMAAATMYGNRWDLLEAAVDEAPRDGLFLEFGVAKGASAAFIAERLAPRSAAAVLHAFDSFEGLPEAWHGTFETRGKFGVGGAIPALPANVAVHKGWFSETLAGFRRQNHEGGIALLHVDCDLYSSTATVFQHVGDLLQPGSILIFDEYFNYHGWQNHEFRAWREFVAERRVSYAYRGFCAQGGHVFLRIEGIGQGAGAGE